MALKSLKI